MILLADIGNTHTHFGLARGDRIARHVDIPTRGWFRGAAASQLRRWVGSENIDGMMICSVVPQATPVLRRMVKRMWKCEALELTPRTLRGVGIDYPKPRTIGPDRLANSVAARHAYGAPVVVVDFGTAVTFDVVNRAGDYVGGVIAPGLAVMTDYLHEKTALLPRIRIREIDSAIGKSTAGAMRVGAVHGYRGLVRELILKLKSELGSRHLSVVATGGYAELIAKNLPEIAAIDPLLTLKGLQLVWQDHFVK